MFVCWASDETKRSGIALENVICLLWRLWKEADEGFLRNMCSGADSKADFKADFQISGHKFGWNSCRAGCTEIYRTVLLHAACQRRLVSFRRFDTQQSRKPRLIQHNVSVLRRLSLGNRSDLKPYGVVAIKSLRIIGRRQNIYLS